MPKPIDTPLVSVIVCAYNAEAFLTDAIESLLKQTLDALEIIVVDDGSTDSTRFIVNKYGKHPKVTAVSHDINRGVSAARNFGLAQARGAYVGFADADDTVHPEMFALMLDAALRHDSDIVTCGCTTYSEKSGLHENAPLRYPANSLLRDESLRSVLSRGFRDKLY